MLDSNININEIKNFINDKHLNLEEITSDLDGLNVKLETLSSQGIYSGPEFIELSKSVALKNEIKFILIELNNFIDQYEQASVLINDPDLGSTAQEEIAICEKNIKELYLKIRELSLASLPNDDKKAILEFRPGVGGVEASLFTDELFRSYVRYCNDEGMEVENVSLDYDTEGGIREAVIITNIEGSYGKLRFESGVFRVQRVPKTESGGRIHTSTASIVVLPKLDTTDLNIDPKDIRIDVYRSSGPGGQSVNTTDSAVRITHLPTGITVSCQAGKSQHKNKDMAMSILVSKLSEIKDEKTNSEINSLRENSIKGSDRSSKIRTFNFPQSRVTDHRIGKSWFNIFEIMNGDLGEVVTTVSRELRAELL